MNGKEHDNAQEFLSAHRTSVKGERSMQREVMNADSNSQLPREIWNYLKSNAKRIAVVFFLVYLYRLVEVGSAVFWYPGFGYRWPNTGFQLFPIPISPTSTELYGYPTLELADSFLYLVFVGNGMWIFWIAISLIYITLPLIHKRGQLLSR